MVATATPEMKRIEAEWRRKTERSQGPGKKSCKKSLSYQKQNINTKKHDENVAGTKAVNAVRRSARPSKGQV